MKPVYPPFNSVKAEGITRLQFVIFKSNPDLPGANEIIHIMLLPFYKICLRQVVREVGKSTIH